MCSGKLPAHPEPVEGHPRSVPPGMNQNPVGSLKTSCKLREPSCPFVDKRVETEQPSAFNVNYHLARFHRVSRRYNRAIRLHQQALAERERTLGADHPDTLRSCTGLANSFYAAGHFDVALDLFRETLERRTKTLGPEHSDTLRSRGSLGNCYHAMGDYETAARMHRETLDLRERILGPDHPSTQASRANLAKAEQALADSVNS